MLRCCYRELKHRRLNEFTYVVYLPTGDVRTNVQEILVKCFKAGLEKFNFRINQLGETPQSPPQPPQVLSFPFSSTSCCSVASDSRAATLLFHFILNGRITQVSEMSDSGGKMHITVGWSPQGRQRRQIVCFVQQPTARQQRYQIYSDIKTEASRSEMLGPTNVWHFCSSFFIIFPVIDWLMWFSSFCISMHYGIHASNGKSAIWCSGSIFSDFYSKSKSWAETNRKQIFDWIVTVNSYK